MMDYSFHPLIENPFIVFICIILFIICQITVPFKGLPFSFFAGLYLILLSVTRLSSIWSYYFTKFSCFNVYYETKRAENGNAIKQIIDTSRK
jgi:hypothetical protein